MRYKLPVTSLMVTKIHIPRESHLSEYVVAIGEICTGQKKRETILPQGVVELVFNLADGMSGQFTESKNELLPPRCFVQGLNTESLEVNYSGEHHLFGIRLHIHRVWDLIGVIPSELKNSVVDLNLVQPNFRSLWHQIKEAESFQERITIIENTFPVLVREDCVRTKRLCNLFLSGNVEYFQSIDKLSKEVCYSSRHLNRKVQGIFGMSGEELISYKKFLHAVNQIHTVPKSLTEIAYQSGFYDQAHFSRIFRNFSGMTPKRYRLNKSEVPFHLFGRTNINMSDMYNS